MGARSRKGFRTVNLPDSLCAWIDSSIRKPDGERPLGAKSRDELVRLAVGLVIMATQRAPGPPPLRILMDLVRRLEEGRDPD